MTPLEREKQTDRIRKVLALASDPSITEGEQDNYRRRARILMEQYCIAHIEDLEDKEHAIVSLPFEPYKGLVITRDLFVVLPHIIQPVARYFGCFVVIHTSGDGFRHEELVGYKPNIEMAQYALNVVLRQGVEEFKRLYRLERSITFGQSFWSGFALGIEKKFKLEAPANTETGLVLYDKVKTFVDEITGGHTTNCAIDMSRPDYIQQGKNFGENVTVHRGVESGGGKGNLLG